MANIIRTAKSGSDWTQNELDAYNINVLVQDFKNFFGVDYLPDPSISQEVLDNLDARSTKDITSYRFIRNLDLAMHPSFPEESAVDDFASYLLSTMGYIEWGRTIRTRKDIRLYICGERRHAKTDVCIIDDEGILLLIQENKATDESGDPEAQLIAEAIAAFDYNNEIRKRTFGRNPINFKVMLGITMTGTSPIFYKIPVTNRLVKSVSLGVFPEEETKVISCIPEIPRPERRYSEGMKPLDNRLIILKYFEAFKNLLNSLNN